MTDGPGATNWFRAGVLGALAGLLPVPLVLVGAQLWAGLAGADQAQAQIILARMGLLLGLGGGALLAMGAGWWAARSVGRYAVGHGLVAGIAAALTGAGLVLALGASLTVPIVLAWLFRPPAGALGGWFARGRAAGLGSAVSSRRGGSE